MISEKRGTSMAHKVGQFIARRCAHSSSELILAAIVKHASASQWTLRERDLGRGVEGHEDMEACQQWAAASFPWPRFRMVSAASRTCMCALCVAVADAARNQHPFLYNRYSRGIYHRAQTVLRTMSWLQSESAYAMSFSCALLTGLIMSESLQGRELLGLSRRYTTTGAARRTHPW